MAKKKNVIRFFESIGEFSRDLNAIPADQKARKPSAFNGNESFEGAQRSLTKGRLSVVPKADKLIDKLTGESIELESPQWEQSVAGYFPCVPAYVAGFPDSMWHQALVKTDRAPMRIFASVCVSAGVDAEDLEKRGVAILALCQKLQSVRPIELYLYADMGDDNWATIPVVKIETSPLDLSTATYALSGAGFLRQLCFSWAMQYGWSGRWAWDLPPTSEMSQRLTRQALHMNDEDLLIGGGDVNDPLIQSPVEWINHQVSLYTEATA